MSAQPYYDQYGNQYDPNAQYASQYDPNAEYSSQYDPNAQYASQYDPNAEYASQYDPNDPYALQYAENQYEDSDPFAEDYSQNEPYQLADPYGEPEAPYEPPYRDSADHSAATLTTPTRASNVDEPEYYVSLEPCARASSCSLYDSVEPKCMIRLVGKGYQKDIELSLDSKMDSLVYRIFRCLEDEGICLDGIRLQGLPKKNSLKNCLAAICAPFTALCSGPLTKPVCCQTLPRPCCCTPSTCPKRSLDISPRRSTLSARYSVASTRPSVCSTRSRRRRPRPRRRSNYPKPSYCRRPCRMAKVCQGPGKEDCVLIKISPSLPKLGGVKCKKRSTGVGTDEFPELEILLQGGRKKRCAAKNKGKICVCPHCCSGGKVKVIKCRSRVPKRKEPLKERPREEKKREKEWNQQHEDEWPPYQHEHEPEHSEQPSKSLDQMSEGELSDLLDRLEREDNRFSFRQPPPPRSSVNFVLVESHANPFQKSKFIESESHIVLPKKVDVGTEPLEPKYGIIEPIEYDAPLKVYSVHQRAQNAGQVMRNEHSDSSKNKKTPSDPETGLLMREVLRLANEILKNQNKIKATDSPKNSHSGRNEKTPKIIRAKNEVNNIFRRSDLWLSGSDVASNDPTDRTQPASPVTTARPRHFSSKSINFVARLKKSYRSKKSPKKSFKVESGSRNQEESNNKFEKLKIYLETDKKDKPAEFVPIELTKKEASICLNTLIR